MAPREFMEKMTDEARFGLGMDILRDSSIPTIQALLQQSGRESMFGNSSQAWTFAGIAFRMAFDIGNVQIVPGAGFPLNFTNGRFESTGGFLYLSIEPAY